MNSEIIKGRDFVIVGLTPYDVKFGSNCVNIAEEIAKHNRVLYVNRPVDRFSLFKQKADPIVQKRKNVLNGKEEDLQQVSDNLWTLSPKAVAESVNWLNVDFVFDYFTKINNQRIAAEIQKAIQKLNFNDVILFNDNDIFRSFHLKELLRPDRYVYYIRDYLIGLEYWARHGKRMEEKLIRKSDVVVANSTYLSHYASAFTDKSYYVGQGCDVSRFNSTLAVKIPKDMKGITRPIIGYVGALDTNRLDISILTYLARKKPEWNLVLVGAEDERFRQSELHSFQNVHFLGLKNIKELPDYIKHFDVCLNPQSINPLTIGNYPRKIDEYLAMGKPVVATKTKAMEVFEEHVYLASTREEYLLHIERALEEDCRELSEKRIHFALDHTWENSVLEIYKAINSTYSQPRGKMVAGDKVKVLK